MVAKKKVKKVIKKPVKKISKKTAKKVVSKSKRMIRSNKRKISLVLNNLILFAILFVVSLVLYNVSGKEIYENLFFLLSMVFGFVAVAFLIVLLALFFLKAMKK